MAKMNSLIDVRIIKALYAASSAGVEINLHVRGMCALKSRIPGVSENIRVASIIDRFLEHTRIFCFANGGEPLIYLSSADWMPRNFDRRVEIAFPIDDEGLKERLVEMLGIYFSDTVKLRVQRPDGEYERIDRRGKEHIRAQAVFLEL
jgi:polyphosphate kinase